MCDHKHIFLFSLLLRSSILLEDTTGQQEQSHYSYLLSFLHEPYYNSSLSGPEGRAHNLQNDDQATGYLIPWGVGSQQKMRVIRFKCEKIRIRALYTVERHASWRCYQACAIPNHCNSNHDSLSPIQNVMLIIFYRNSKAMFLDFSPQALLSFLHEWETEFIMNSPGTSTNPKCMWFEVTNDRMLLQGLVGPASRAPGSGSSSLCRARWLLPTLNTPSLPPSTPPLPPPHPATTTAAEALSLASLGNPRVIRYTPLPAFVNTHSPRQESCLGFWSGLV